jgi:outer membrane protein TolC
MTKIKKFGLRSWAVLTTQIIVFAPLGLNAKNIETKKTSQTTLELQSNWENNTKVENFSDYLKLGRIEPPKNSGRLNLTDKELVKIGLANSPEIRSSIYQYRQTDYEVRSAYAAYFPTITAFNTSIGQNNSNSTFEFGGEGYGNGKTREEQRQIDTINANSTGITNYYQGLLGVQLSYNLVDIPRDLSIAQAMESRKYYKTLISYAVKQKLQSLRLAIVSVQSADKLIKAYQNSAAFAKKAYEQILKSYQGGYTTKIDVDNYFALYNGYQANVAASMATRQAAVSQLLAQMSWPQTIDIEMSDNLEPPKDWPIDLANSIKLADKNSELIQNLIIQSKINKIQAKSELANYLPVVSFNAYGYLENQNGQIYIGDPPGSTNRSTNSSISLNLSWTLFDGLGNLNNSRAYKQSMYSFEQQSESQKYSVQQSVHSGYAAIKGNLTAFKLNSKAYESLQQLTKLTLKGYQSGYNTVFDLVNAQQDNVSSLIGIIQNNTTVNSNLIQMQTNTGAYACENQSVKYACDLLVAFESKDFTKTTEKKQ